MKKLLLFKKMIIVILLAGMSMAGWAQVLLHEPFNYATPAYIGGNGNAGTSSNGWMTHSVTTGQTTTVDIQDGSLDYTGLAASTGNKVFLFSNKGATSRDVNKPITSTAKVLYFSALVNIVDTVQLKTGDYFMSFGGAVGSSISLLGARLGAKLAPTPALKTFRFVIKNNSGTGEAWTDNGVDLTVGTTYLVVVKYDISAAVSVATMWINPASLGGTEPAGGISNNSGTNTFTTFASICLRNGSSGTPKSNVDEIRVGTTWADVTPVGGNVGLIRRDQANRKTSIYPNPAKSFFNVKAPEGDYLVSINNSIGSLVKSTELNSNGKVEMADLRPGIYYVTVENENTNVKEVHKLIVR